MGTKMQMKALSVLKAACERLAPDKGVLTPAHPAFLQLCLMSNNFHLAQRLMQVPIYAVDKDTGMDVEDYLTYWYYAGIVQSALKQFRQAQNSFLQVFIYGPRLLVMTDGQKVNNILCLKTFRWRFCHLMPCIGRHPCFTCSA